ncbi:MAG: hypothetical protein GOVbin225_1 [Prokaryotic dsDNA virus sp.]|nr:MAG: hypothetical protein GOVbin225_1 [Prokaryotic dsDNA virus sp.]|tara:strand:- start:148 stop:516 length:369 start_codon:yes stop_codon:yes gene_type:complete
MAISLGSGSISALKLGSTAVTKAYLGSTQVFPVASGVATATLSVAGNIRTGNGTYASTQYATSGGGSGATFDVVINNRTATSFSVTGAGTGYAVGDTITLQVGSVSSMFQSPRVELTVASLG